MEDHFTILISILMNPIKIKISKILWLSAIIIVQISCTAQVPTDLTKENIIPKPVSVTATGDSFEFTDKTDIFYPESAPEIEKIAQYLARSLNPATGLDIRVRTSDREPRRSHVYLATGDPDPELGAEGYLLDITGKSVRLTANQPEGLFRGVQTLLQLLPAEIELTTVQNGPWIIPTGTIRDFPVYSYRGVMLDVARHFFRVEDVKRFIDLASRYKMNRMHLHLSDDQGWRIEIKSWPNLTAHGGSTQVGGGPGGFYTQEQYADIVNYAGERYVTVIPEIDMPGHTNAALASYAELNCSGTATKLYTGTNVGFSTLCTNKEVTYKFIDDVVRELATVTPGPWIHIGGDESHVTKVEDYIPFINRVQDIVLSHGKQMMGWDDIAIAALKPGTIAQHWATVKNAQQAVAQGAKLLISPAKKAYIDMQYDPSTKLGLHWAGYLEVDTAYIWDPARYIPGISRENIIGIEAPLWSETITKMDEIEYMAFPRLPGYAEIGWTADSLRNWDEYKVRLGNHGRRMSLMGIDYYRSPKVPWAE